MMNFKYTMGAAAVALLSASAANASVILVDDFSAAGGVVATFQGNPATTTTVDAGILGGSRDMWASTDGSASFGTSFEVAAGSDTLAFSNASAATGQAVLIYDGDGAGSPFGFEFDDLAAGVSNQIDVDTDGLGGVDFLLGDTANQRSFTFSGSDFDNDAGSIALFRAYAWDTDDNLVTFEETIGGGVDFSANLGLADFTNVSGVFNWESVGALAFSIEAQTNNFDGSISGISVVPLPASALLLLGGLGGLAGARTVATRRRRKDA